MIYLNVFKGSFESGIFILYDTYILKEYKKKIYLKILRILSKILNVNVTNIEAYRGGS